MLKVLIWQVSPDTAFKDTAIKILEQQHDGIEIVGEAVNEDIAKVDGGDYEILVVGARLRYGNARMAEVNKKAKLLNLSEEKVLGDWIVCIPGFTLDKYRLLQKSHLSIISRNCFGGVISNLLNLPFRSPFVNMNMIMEYFFKFLHDPHAYLEKEPTFYKMFKDFPLLSLEDIRLDMVHYKTSEEAIEKWNERKQRINWNNLFVVADELFVMPDTSRYDLLKQFDSLPYAKKICFVSFKSDLHSLWYLPPGFFQQGAISLARGDGYCYDIFDMLLYGKKTPLIEM